MNKTSEQRRNMTIVLVVVFGLLIGLFIKRVPVGLLIGVVLGLLVASFSAKRK